jgi:hypothetical protein
MQSDFIPSLQCNTFLNTFCTVHSSLQSRRLQGREMFIILRTDINGLLTLDTACDNKAHELLELCNGQAHVVTTVKEHTLHKGTRTGFIFEIRDVTKINEQNQKA